MKDKNGFDEIGMFGLFPPFNGNSIPKIPEIYNKLTKESGMIGIALCDACDNHFPITRESVNVISTPNGDKKAYYKRCPKCGEVIGIEVEE